MPIIQIIGDNPIIIDLTRTPDMYQDPGAKAFDSDGNDITKDIHVSGDVVNTSIANKYSIKYDVKDADGNAATQAIRIVEVRKQGGFAMLKLAIKK